MDSTNAIETFNGAWTTVQPAISAVFGAVVSSLFLRKNTAKEEIEKIKQVKFSEIADTLLELGHITHLEYYKCRNFAKIAKKADEIYRKKQTEEKTQSESDRFIDFDWFVRFFEDCGGISNEDMQELWAEILAGEILEPGSFSRQTLDVLRNLSQADAQLFEEISRYILLSDVCTFVYANLSSPHLSGYNIRLSKIYHLDSCGLLSSHHLMVRQPMEYDDTRILFNTKDFMCRLKSIKEPPNAPPFGTVNISSFVVTRAGRELLKIIGVQPEKDFLLDVIAAFNKEYSHNNCVKATLHKVNDSKLGYDETPISQEDTDNA